MSRRGAEPLGKKAQKELIVQKKKAFLEAYASLGTVTHASIKAGTDRHSIKRWRHADKDFDKAVMDAESANVDNLRLTAYQRAINGTSKGADTLLIFLLKAADPEKYRERYDVKGSGFGFTMRDFLAGREREAPHTKGNISKDVRPPGVVFDRDLGNRGVEQTNGNHRKPEES